MDATVHTYIHTCKFCCRLRLAVSEKYDVRGALNLSRSIREAKKQADLKSTVQRNYPFREGRLGSM